MQKHLSFHSFFISKHALQTRLYFENLKVEGHTQLPSNLRWTFHTWWNTNYIAHVKKLKETEKTPASQTWSKQSTTVLYSTLNLVRRIRSFEE